MGRKLMGYSLSRAVSIIFIVGPRPPPPALIEGLTGLIELRRTEEIIRICIYFGVHCEAHI